MNFISLKVNPAMASKGFSLVELMVSITIGLFLIVGATTVYINSRKSSDVDETTARLQETARYALSVIESDVRMANYWGLVKSGGTIVNSVSQTHPANPSPNLVTAPSASACGATYPIDVENYIAATNNSYGFGCAAKTGAVSSADTLTIRRASVSVPTTTDSRLRICSNYVDAQIIKGNTCAPDVLRDLIVDGYYVDQQSDQSTTYPSLRRKTLGLDPGGSGQPGFSDTEIIPGIQNMQVQLGWDSTTTSATAVQYVNPGSSVLPTGQVVAVRVWLLVRSELPDSTYTDTHTYQYADTASYAPNDHYRRLLVSRTFFLRNVVGT